MFVEQSERKYSEQQTVQRGTTADFRTLHILVSQAGQKISGGEGGILPTPNFVNY